MNAARNGKKQIQLLRKKRLADGKLFSRLTAHANGRPEAVTGPYTRPSQLLQNCGELHHEGGAAAEFALAPYLAVHGFHHFFDD
jgi:hypothetical protein